MNKTFFFLWVILYFVLLQSAKGQEPGMWQLTDEAGLPSMTVYHTIQDRQGYIWIATENGLCRFDGKVYKTYKSPEFNDYEILMVAEDSIGRIWFNNLSGQLFYIQDDIIHNVQDLIPEKSMQISAFVISGHTIFISRKMNEGNQEHSLAYLSFDNQGVFLSLFDYDRIFKYTVYFHITDQSVFMIGSPKGVKSDQLFLLDEEVDTLIDKSSFPRDKFGEFRSIFFYLDEMYAAVNHKGNSWLLKSSGANFYLFKEFKNSDIRDIVIIDDVIWILTQQGIVRQSLDHKAIKNKPQLLDGMSINHLMMDREGNKWIATAGHGLYVITAPQTQVFGTRYFNLQNEGIYSLEYDHLKDRLLVGHSNGMISLIDKHLDHRSLSIHTSGRTLDFLVDHKGNYWCANDPYLVLLDTHLIEKSKEFFSAKTILQATNLDIWVGNFAHVRMTSNDHAFDNKLLIKPILNERTYALLEDYSNHIWMGTTKGIYIYQDSIIPFLENEKHIPYNTSSIVQAEDSVIWVATRGKGLLGIKEKEVIYRFNEESGLASNTVKRVLASADVLWIGTDNGLNKLNLKTHELEWINTLDGLPSNDVNDIEVIADQVWVGTAKGLANFSIDANHRNETRPPIYISGVKLEERDTIVQDSFYLRYDQNDIRIDFTGIGFRGKGAISYEYKMFGADKNWVHTQSRFSRYGNLLPGDYVFEVVAISEDNVKSKAPATIRFSISPPWWQTWWFRVLSVLTLAGVIGFAVHFWMRRRRRNEHFLYQVSELKKMALRSQMNSHFIFNALNAIQNFLTTNNRKQAMYYLSQFGKLIRLIFEQSQMDKISLEDELEFIRLYLNLEKLRFMDNLTIQLEVSPELIAMSDEIYLPPLLIQPIIENSFKHGFLYKEKSGVLKINFSRKDACLICTIEDDGIGRKKAAELSQQTFKNRPSSGLKTAKKRLQIYNQSTRNLSSDPSGIHITDLYDDDGVVRGTLVEVCIYCVDFELVE